jgi:hypothetical protein
MRSSQSAHSSSKPGAGRPLPFAAWLLRPFIDLEPCRRGPLYARGLEQYWLAFADPRRPRFVLQRTLPQPFRTQFLAEAMLFEYQADDPRSVPATLWSSRWRAMCEALDAWPELPTDHQCRLVLLLHALCFYSLVDTLARGGPLGRLPIEDPDQAELAYWRASARYVLGLPSRVADYQEADLFEFDCIAATAPKDVPLPFNAAL